ncbi:hypothetical protein [Microbacterium sp. cf332]|uniref:hypothetical protein n=1 Tax=Microbacterium sp. cf332 TaxID=1761804 RepID=UPI0008925700|nr:hypothetical protein [Microbacterium sp. cf332]SDQ05353.1 hypothetical protein SAMN04487847_0058 [Microbacterium sp. cf332]
MTDANADSALPRVVAVRRGRVQPSGSWVYAWIDVASSEVTYVGATGFDPELRAHLHLDSDDPNIGRVRAEVGAFAERDFDVVAFALPPDIDRAHARRVLAARLGLGPAAGPVDDVLSGAVNATVSAIERYREGIGRA